MIGEKTLTDHSFSLQRFCPEHAPPGSLPQIFLRPAGGLLVRKNTENGRSAARHQGATGAILQQKGLDLIQNRMNSQRYLLEIIRETPDQIFRCTKSRDAIIYSVLCQSQIEPMINHFCGDFETRIDQHKPEWG